jgi:phospholipase A-2-activating protein
VCGFDFDLTFLLRFQAKDRKESLAFIRLVTVLYCDPPFNLECLFVVVQKLRDIGYLSDEDLDDYYNNRTVRKQLQSRNY